MGRWVTDSNGKKVWVERFYESSSLSDTSGWKSRKHRGLNHLKQDWGNFVKRVRRETGFRFDFFRIITSEGNGVIHAIFRCRKTDFCLSQGWSYEAIHAYFSCLWMELHSAFVVWVTSCYKVGGNFSKLVRYLVSQYVIGQSFLHLGYSGNWCFKGFVKRFKELIRRNGFKLGLLAWRNTLMSVEIPVLPVFVEKELEDDYSAFSAGFKS